MSINVDPNAAHAVYAPSSAHRWTVCTASATAIAALGEQEEGEEAAEGTRAHDEIERVLGPLDGHEYAGGDWTALLGEQDADHPAAYGIALVVDYVRQLPYGKMWIEQRVRLTDQIWGRCDVAHWDEASATLTIVDYKNGFVDVDAVENEQLRIYGAGSIYTHKLPAKWIRYVVVQPNSFMPVPRVKQWIEDAGSLFAFASKTAAIPNMLHWEPGEGQNAGGYLPDPSRYLTFTAGEQCKYCPLFGRCPASQDVLLKLNVMLANPPDAVRPDQVATFMACKKPIEDWFKSLDKAATKSALSGAVPAGMKLVQTVKHRAWIDEAAARAAILAAHGPNALDVPTPSQAEKLGGVDVATLSSKPEGGPALAFESDKRAAWAPRTAQDMFKGVTG